MKEKKEADIFSKYIKIYFLITFSMVWVTCLSYIFFEPFMTSIFGELVLTNPLVVIALDGPAVVGLAMYYLYAKGEGVKKYLCTLIPRKKDLKWFPIIIVTMILYLIAVRMICIGFQIAVPEMTYSLKEMLIIFLKNFYEEIGMIGVAFGWFGFVLPYYQRKYQSNIKAGMMTGLTLGLFVAPGYIFSSFETATAYPWYVLQLMVFSICISYILNDTRGNAIFFLVAFWIAGTGSKVNFYYFVPSVQIIQFAIFGVLALILHYMFKHINKGKDPKSILQVFPDFIEMNH